MSYSTISLPSAPASGVPSTPLLDQLAQQRKLIAQLEQDKVLLSTKNLSLRNRLTEAKRSMSSLERSLVGANQSLNHAQQKRDAAFKTLNSTEHDKKLLAETAAELRARNALLEDRVLDLQRALLDHHGLVADDELQVADVAQRLVNKPHRRIPSTKPEQLNTVFTPKIPMTPVRAFAESDYVAVGESRTVAIMSPAFAAVTDTGEGRLECDVSINDTFMPIHAPDNPMTLMYLGFLYPDGTSLPYIPVRDVLVQYRGDVPKTRMERSREVYGQDLVVLSVPRLVYERLVRAARKVFEWRFGANAKWVTEVDVEGDRVWVEAGMKRGAKVQCFVEGRRGERYVGDALRESGQDLKGDAMLYMRFSFREREDSLPTLCFRLHKLIVEKALGAAAPGRAAFRRLLSCGTIGNTEEGESRIGRGVRRLLVCGGAEEE